MVGKKGVIAIVIYNDKVLVGKKKKTKKILAGKWHIPGETLKENEDDKTALIRGIKEEAGIDIRVVRSLASHITPEDIEVKWYECKAKTFDIKAGSDLSDVKWVPIKEVRNFCDDESIALWPKEIREYFNYI